MLCVASPLFTGLIVPLYYDLGGGGASQEFRSEKAGVDRSSGGHADGLRAKEDAQLGSTAAVRGPGTEEVRSIQHVRHKHYLSSALLSNAVINIHLLKVTLELKNSTFQKDSYFSKIIVISTSSSFQVVSDFSKKHAASFYLIVIFSEMQKLDQ